MASAPVLRGRWLFQRRGRYVAEASQLIYGSWDVMQDELLGRLRTAQSVRYRT
jgi:hypothetical protein